MKTIQFEPFEEMFLRSSRAGHHDGAKSVVGLDYTSSLLVQRHEWVHGQVFAQSPDGQLLAALLHLYNVNVEALGLSRQRHNELTLALMNASRTAHEAAATYLSVKMETPEVQPGLLALLDPEYRKYYSILAEVLDDRIGSSYLQYLVAWNAICVSFSSRYLERFSADPTIAGLQPETEEQPNARLVAILDSLRTNFDRLLMIINHRLREVCERHSVAYWDPHQESGWVTLQEQNHSMLTEVEAQLTLVLRPFLIEISKIPVLLDDEHRRAFEALSRWLHLARANFQKMAAYDWRTHDEQVAEAIDAHNQAGGEVRVAGAKPLARQPSVEDWSLIDPSYSFLFIEDENSDDGPWTNRESFIARLQADVGDDWLRSGTANRWWNGFAWHGQPYRGEPSKTSGLTQEKLLSWLRIRSQSGLKAASSIVLVTRPRDVLHLMTHQTLLYEELGVDRGSHDPGRTFLPLCHYLQGNWFQWFEEMRWLRDAFSPMAPWKLIFGNVKLPSPSSGSLVLHILWHGFFGVSFFRLTSPHVSERMMPEMDRLLKQDDVKLMDVDEARMLRSLYEGIVIPRLLSCWSSF